MSVNGLQYSDLLNQSDINLDSANVNGLTCNQATINEKLNLGYITPSKPLKSDSNNNVVSDSIDLSNDDVKNILPIAKGGTNSYLPLTNNKFMISSGGSILEATELKDGQIFIGSSTSAPIASSITGTTNRINVTNGPGSITLSTPQDISTSSDVKFNSLTSTSANITTLTATNATLTDATLGTLTLSPYVDNYLLKMNNTGLVVAAMNAADVCNLSGNQTITGDKIFNNCSISSLTSTNSTLTNLQVTNQLLIDVGASGSIYSLATNTTKLNSGTAGLPLRLDSNKFLTTGSIGLNTTDTIGILPISKGGTNNSATLNNNRFMISSGGAISEAVVLTDGQIFVGVTSSTPIAKTIAGTANQISVTNGTSAITLSTPQNISTSSNVTFNAVTSTSSSIETLTATNATITSATCNTVTTQTLSAYTGNTTGTLDPSIGLTSWYNGSKYTDLKIANDPTNRNVIKYNSMMLGLPAGSKQVFNVDGYDVCEFALNSSTSSMMTTTNATITNGTIGTLTCTTENTTTGNITTLTSTSGNITTGTIGSLTSTTGNITTLTSTSGTITNLTCSSINNSSIDVINSGSAQSMNFGTTSSSTVSKTLNLGSQSNSVSAGQAIIRIGQNNALEFGAGITKEKNAGKIAYGTFDTGASLNIVGAGTGSNRLIRMWEHLGINAAPTTSASLTTGGAISCGGSLSALSCSLTGAMTCNSLTSTSCNVTSGTVGTLTSTTGNITTLNSTTANLSSIVFPAGSGGGTLGYLNQGSVTLTFSGAIPANNVTVNYQIIGNHVLLKIKAFLATSNASSYITSTALSAPFRPMANVCFPCRVTQNGLFYNGCCILNATTGTLTFYQTIGGGFFSSGLANTGIDTDTCFSYFV